MSTDRALLPRPSIVTDPRPRTWAVAGAVLTFVVGSTIHSLFHVLGSPTAVAGLLPINESVWEHAKMGYWPVLAFGALAALAFRERRRRLAVATSAAGLVTPLGTLGLFYLYTPLVGDNLLVLDVAVFLLSIVAGFALWVRVMTGPAPRGRTLAVALGAAVLLGVAFWLFTFAPPHLEPFRDPLTGEYGLHTGHSHRFLASRNPPTI